MMSCMRGNSSGIRATVTLGAVLWAAVCFGGAVSAAESTLWDFERNSGGWRAAGDGVTVDTAGSPPESGGGRCLRIVIDGAPGLVAVQSDAMPMGVRDFYRISADMRVERTAPGAPVPRLACYYRDERDGSWLGQGLADAYDMSRPGTWQRVTGEFRVPYGATRGQLVVAAPDRLSDGLQSGTVSLDNVRIEPIPHYTIAGRYQFDPMPASLERMHGVHPRMYLTRDRIARLKELIATSHRDLWEEVREKTDTLVDTQPTDYMDIDEYPSTEQLYMRGVGNYMPYLALAWVLTGEEKYLDAAEAWALKACSYPTWGLDEFANVDLSTGHQLYGLSLVYDWCYDDLSESTKRTIRETMYEKSANLFDLAAKGIIVGDAEAYVRHPWPEWDEAYLQNHMWINACGLAAAGMAIYDEYPEATRWMAFTLDRYRRTMAILGEDGASHEGPGYWGYGVDWMLKFMELSRDLLDADLYNHPWWRNTATYRIYMGLPEHSWTSGNSTVDVGDSRRYDWYGPDYMLRRLASEYGDGHARWLADATDETDVAHPVDSWLNILWHDPAVRSRPLNDLPTMYHFTDMDIATTRSDWSGDESFLFFKCGPYVGHNAIQTFTYCPSSAHHVHPDTGNFMVFAEGEWLIIDDGYRAKYTGYHNTLLIDGGEQLGGGFPIFNGAEPHGVQARPRIITAESGSRLDHLAGDATEAYPADSGLKRFTRHLLFLKPDVLIVLDDIAVDGGHELELRFHPEQQTGTRDGDAYVMQGKRAVFRLDPLTPADVTMRDDILFQLPKNASDGEAERYTIRMQKYGSSWRNAVALTWSGADSRPAQVALQRDGDVWRFTAPEGTVRFDWETGMASVE